MKKYLYHRVPPQMMGTLLYPLNELKNIDESLYLSGRSKYVNREWLLAKPIPCLNCLWNDVIFLTATHPQDIANLQQECGLPPSKLNPFYYKIDMEQLDLSLLGVFENEPAHSNLPEKFSMFRSELFGHYATLHNKVREHYERLMREKGPISFRLAFVTHILYKGSIDISNAEIIEVKTSRM